MAEVILGRVRVLSLARVMARVGSLFGVLGVFVAIAVGEYMPSLSTKREPEYVWVFVFPVLGFFAGGIGGFVHGLIAGWLYNLTLLFWPGGVRFEVQIIDKPPAPGS